jgi:hypothetical protein
LVIAFPRVAGGYSAHEIELFPGEPGKRAGCVKMKGGGVVAGARIVEAPKGTPGSMTFEASIPWRTLPEAALVRIGLRGALKYYDGNGRIQNVLSTSTDAAPADLPRLLTEPEQSLAEGLLREHGITRGPNQERYADVAGDAMLERVLVYGRFLVVLGPHFRQGKEYYFADLVADADLGQIPSFEVRDVNGDGKADVVLRRRIVLGDGYREIAQVFTVIANDTLEPIFTHEVGIRSPVGTIANDLRFVTEGGKPGIVVAVGTSSGFTASNYHEPVEPSMEPLLLPWAPIKAQVYQWTGQQFAKIREDKQAPKAIARKGAAAAGPEIQLSFTARPPTRDELQDQLYALYKKERGVKKQDKPRFDLAADLAEDAQNERLLLHGRDLVVFGKGYKKGIGYAYISLDQFADPAGIVDVTARDLTGDGKAEIIVRGVLHATPPKEMGFDKDTVVDREILLVYEVTSQGISRVFGAETGRAIGGQRVQTGLAFVPGARGIDLELRPGVAFGWNSRTYPFGQDTDKVGGLEPIPLPWSGARAARFRWDGQAFAKQ